MQDSTCCSRLYKDAIPPHILEATHTFLNNIRDWHPLRNCSTLWFVKQPCCCMYSYSKYAIPCLPFSPILQSMADHIEKTLNVYVDSVNANYYPNAKASLGYHTDDEDLFQAKHQPSTIVSVSFGATRKFAIKNIRTGADSFQNLSHGDLITMEGLMQRFYQHSICQAPFPVEDRLNLTFRFISAHEDYCHMSHPS